MEAFIDPIKPWNSQRAKEMDKISVEEFILVNGWTDQAKDQIRSVVRCILCVEPCEVSLLFWIWYMHNGNGIMCRVSNMENGA